MKLLLKVKNGTPPQRKSALRQLTDKARDLGAGPLFNQILPLLMSPTLEDQERHLLVKVCFRACFCAQLWLSANFALLHLFRSARRQACPPQRYMSGRHSRPGCSLQVVLQP